MKGIWALFAAAALASGVALPGVAATQGGEGRAYDAGAAAGNAGRPPASRGNITREAGGERDNGSAVERRGNGATDRVKATPALISRVQQTLNILGYSAQPLTGTWDRDNAFAMRDFQAEHGLPATGQLNRASLEALGLIPRRAAANTSGGGANTANGESSRSLSALGAGNGTGGGGGMGNNESAGERSLSSGLR
jgi:peptidoglycan hydrolase-like protein with peptidoglycan-binding domain